MTEIDIVYEQDDYTKNGVIIRETEIVTYTVGPRDQGGAETFVIGVFLENPPHYVPAHVVDQVANAVAARGAADQVRIGQERCSERDRLAAEQQAADVWRKEQKANERRRQSVWDMPDPWRGSPATDAKPWWQFW